MKQLETEMRKEKSVTRILIIFSMFLGFHTSVFSQCLLNNTYSYCDGVVDNGTCIRFTFIENGIFKKDVEGELGKNHYGKGHYQIKNDSLILNYDLTEPIKTGYHTSKIWRNNKDSICIKFVLFDLNHKVLDPPAASVMYKDSLSKYGYSGVAANNSGVAVFRLKKEKNNLQFMLSNLGYKPYNLVVDRNYNYEISVFMQNQGEGLPILNQIDTLKIVKQGRKYLEVKNKNGTTVRLQRVVDK